MLITELFFELLIWRTHFSDVDFLLADSLSQLSLRIRIIWAQIWLWSWFWVYKLNYLDILRIGKPLTWIHDVKERILNNLLLMQSPHSRQCLSQSLWVFILTFFKRIKWPVVAPRPHIILRVIIRSHDCANICWVFLFKHLNTRDGCFLFLNNLIIFYFIFSFNLVLVLQIDIVEHASVFNCGLEPKDLELVTFGHLLVPVPRSHH